MVIYVLKMRRKKKQYIQRFMETKFLYDDEDEYFLALTDNNEREKNQNYIFLIILSTCNLPVN